MKISSYHKSKGNNVNLLMDYKEIENYDIVFVSKVFTDTHIDAKILNNSKVQYGGTGFFYDKAPPLDPKIEHSFPDYHLYDEWVEQQLETGAVNRIALKYYLDYSIGFITRGCFRQCEFCVNKNYKKVCKHSPLEEFYDESRPKICLLDDNFFGYAGWKESLDELQATGKPFQFKQGLDERLLTDEKCKALFGSRYDGDYIFAFDNIADAELIENKLLLIRQYTNTIPKFYVFCGFDRNDIWDSDFWNQDLRDLMKRIKILFQHQALPYIMRFNRYIESPYAKVYIELARWCNQPSFAKKKSFREFAEIRKNNNYLTMLVAESNMPELTDYFDMKWSDFI